MRKARPDLSRRRFPVGRVVVDLESDGLQPYDGSRPFLYGMEDENGTVVIIDRAVKGYRKTEEFRAFRRVVEDPRIEKIAHNAKFELKMLLHDGFTPRGRWHDTMIMAHLLNEYEKSISLKYLSRTYLGVSYEAEDTLKAWLKGAKRFFKKSLGHEPNYSDVPRDITVPYLEEDLDNTMRLFWMWIEPIEEFFADVYAWELRLIPYVVQMEDAGVVVDRAYCIKTAKDMTRAMGRATDKCRALAGDEEFNPGSAPQVMAALTDRGCVLRPGRDNKPNVRAKQLKALQDPLADAVIEYREFVKVRNTYMLPFLQLSMGDVLHCSFWQCGEDEGIKTGRFSSSKPSLHNIPIHKSAIARTAVVPRPDHGFAFLDYAQIEVCIFAHYADDERMIADILKGYDFHVANMFRMFPGEIPAGLTVAEVTRLNREDRLSKALKALRFRAKTMNFAVLYGMGLRALAAALGCTVSEAREIRDNYMAAMPSVYRLREDLEAELYRTGYIEDIFGRRYRVPLDRVYKALNALIQGSAAHVMKHGIVHVGEALDDARASGIISPTAGMRMTIHDELALEAPLDELGTVIEIAAAEMEDHTTFKVPIRVDAEWSDKSWGQKEGWHGEAA